MNTTRRTGMASKEPMLLSEVAAAVLDETKAYCQPGCATNHKRRIAAKAAARLKHKQRKVTPAVRLAAPPAPLPAPRTEVPTAADWLSERWSWRERVWFLQNFGGRIYQGGNSCS
jgi:hypothetical protein